MEDRGEVGIVYYIGKRSIQVDDLGVRVGTGVETGPGYGRIYPQGVLVDLC